MREESKFLDLDLVAQQIPHEDDRSLFTEALTCYHVGSHRAAIILAWYATANCVRRRIEEIATDGDGTAQAALNTLKEVEGKAVYEQTLIDQGRRCELYDDFEAKCLTFARDQRSKCAHPTGYTPAAEAVRYILHVCSQTVLCRQGYRGLSYIRDVVTSRFDDPYFLPNNPEDMSAHCAMIAGRVPDRLAAQFAKQALRERPNNHSSVWRENAIGFFRALLSQETPSSREVALGLSGYATSAPELFSVFIGLHPHVARSFEVDQRSQAHRRLTHELSIGRPSSEELMSWANLCTVDGFDEGDLPLLSDRFPLVAPIVSQNPALLAHQSEQIAQVLQNVIQQDLLPESFAGGCLQLFETRLLVAGSSHLSIIVDEIIGRFVHSDTHRFLIQNVQKWNEDLLVGYLERSADFLNKCDEDKADDVILMFEAARELANRNLLLIPSHFSEAVLSSLRGEHRAEWRSVDSELGRTFRAQVDLLVQMHRETFPALASSAPALLSDINEAANNFD